MCVTRRAIEIFALRGFGLRDQEPEKRNSLPKKSQNPLTASSRNHSGLSFSDFVSCHRSRHPAAFRRLSGVYRGVESLAVSPCAESCISGRTATSRNPDSQSPHRLALLDWSRRSGIG